MTKFLLTYLLASAAATGAAATQAPEAIQILDRNPMAKDISALALKKGKSAVTSRQRLGKDAQLLTVKGADGRAIKRIETPATGTKINPLAKRVAKASLPSGIILSEDFEGWDGETEDWLPEGYSLDHKSERDDAESWYVIPESNLSILMSGTTGNALYIQFEMDFLDEWAVLPEVTLSDDMMLSFDTLNDGFWYFSTDNIDWNTKEYIGDKETAYDLKVMISEDGGANWTELKSLASDFEEYNAEQLLSMMTNKVSRVEVPLSDYAGKKVKIAYRYVGTNGNSTIIDNIRIGYPALEARYLNPMGTLFFGMSPETYTLNMSVLTGPVYKPWTFYNDGYADGAEWSWQYMNADSEWDVSDNQDELQVTYRTDYTNDFTTRNNWFYTPVISGYAPNYSEGFYTRGQYLQAGGKGEYEAKTQDGSTRLLNLGLGIIDPSEEGYATYSDALVPLFGYSGDSDKYWTDYTYGEDGGDEENYVRMTGIMNFFYNGEAPVVIKGARTTAFAQLDKGAKFKAEIVPLSDEGVPADEAIATAYCEYDDLLVMEQENSNNDIVTLNFTFDEPVVMSTDVCLAYIVRISGFNDPEHVTYFNPLMSEKNNPDTYALSWIEKSFVRDGGATRTSFTPVANYLEDLNFENSFVGFYITLDAEFPWLEGPESVDCGSDGRAVAIFDSSAAGEDLKFENLPDWLSATAEGIHGETTVTFMTDMTDMIKGSATVTVTAPGVSHDITVNADGNGTAEIEAESGDAEIFNLSGIRIGKMTQPGVYIVKDAKGNVHKTVKN